MSTFPWEQDMLMIAVDPAMRHSAIAVRGMGSDGRVRKTIRRSHSIADIRHAVQEVANFSGLCVYKRVAVAIEYPTWSGHGTPQVRAAANAYLDVLRDIFGPIKVYKVDPKDWQKTFDFNKRSKGQSTKEFSFFLSLGYGWSPQTHDEADATLILEHSRIQGETWLNKS